MAFHTRLHRPTLSRRVSLTFVAVAALSLMLLSSSPTTIPIRDLTQEPEAWAGASLPIAFEPDAGQAPRTVSFVARVKDANLSFLPGQMVLSLPRARSDGPDSRSTMRMSFIGVSPYHTIRGGATLPGRVSYLKGDNPADWQVNLPTYSSITYKSLYPGIDLSYTGSQHNLKGTYYVEPGADPSHIQWRYSGASQTSIDASGNLQIVQDGVGLTEHAPVAWQEVRGRRIPVQVGYHIRADGTVGFRLGSYDPEHMLTIDPAITYATYLGGSHDDTIRSIALDSAGNIYVAGGTLSPDFPTSAPYQPANAGNFDAFISKLDPTGRTLLYSTYIGGTNEDQARTVKVDSQGNAYLIGSTNSLNFPIASAIQGEFGGGDADAFVLKLGPGSESLIYSTYLGGESEDRGIGLTLGQDGSAFITGPTWSSDFPTHDPLQTYCGTATYADGYVAKINPQGSALVYSTYLCGDDDDRGIAITTDHGGNAYVTGHTNSDNFPTQNPYQSKYMGHQDAFVAKLNASGSALVYSTYFGGMSDEAAWTIALDSQRNAYISGFTRSPDLPLLNPVQSQPGGDDDVYLTIFDAAGANLLFSTYLAGSGREFGQGVAVAPDNSVTLVGRTSSANFPTLNPIQPQLRGESDAFVARFSPTGNPLLYSTFVGGSSLDEGWAVALDPQGNAYLAGGTFSTDFPVADPYQAANNGYYDGFIARVSNSTPASPGPTLTATPTLTPVATACSTQFNDVPTSHTFYQYIRCMACRSIITGYADGTFRPNNQVTRGQLAKIVSNAAGFQENPGPQIFQDVPANHTFYEWINRLTNRGYMSGYTCGSPGEPCVNDRPYFRPYSNATRAQASKIIANAAQYNEPPTGQTFEDVPPSHAFYEWIQRLAGRGIMGGYQCGGPGEPCVPNGRPYFRPYNEITRGQSSKIAANAFYSECGSRTLLEKEFGDIHP